MSLRMIVARFIISLRLIGRSCLNARLRALWTACLIKMESTYLQSLKTQRFLYGILTLTVTSKPNAKPKTFKYRPIIQAMSAYITKTISTSVT